MNMMIDSTPKTIPAVCAFILVSGNAYMVLFGLERYEPSPSKNLRKHSQSHYKHVFHDVSCQEGDNTHQVTIFTITTVSSFNQHKKTQVLTLSNTR